MSIIRSWTSTPAILRHGLSGLTAGGLGGMVLIGLVLALDIAHLRSLTEAASSAPTVWEWLTVPCAFAATGLSVAVTSGRGG